MAAVNPVNPTLDLTPVKMKQQDTWASGDYAVIGVRLQIVGELLCEALDLRAGSTVLDVAAGDGSATLAAARRWCRVTSTDYVAALLDRGRERAVADRLPVEFRVADAEALPFADESFDVVISTFGVMFAPDQEKSAAELLRVCRRGGKIGLANWTPDGFVGQLFRTIGKHVPPPAGVRSPALWGTPSRLDELFGAGSTIDAQLRLFMFRYESPAHWLDVFRSYFGPMLKVFSVLDQAGQQALVADLISLVARFNRASDGAMVVPGEYLEIVISKR